MPQFVVTWREIHTAQSIIEANSAEEALRIAQSLEPDDIDTIAANYESEWVEDVEDSYTAEEFVGQVI